MRPLLIIALYECSLLLLVSASETPSRSPSFEYNSYSLGYASSEDDDQTFIPNSAKAREVRIDSVPETAQNLIQWNPYVQEAAVCEDKVQIEEDESAAQETLQLVLPTKESEVVINDTTPVQGDFTPSASSYASIESNEAIVESNEYASTSVTSSLFPHAVGIKNHALNCYASALISCLYNIPLFHATLFETLQKNLENNEMMIKTESITAAIATVLYKLRFAKSTVALDTFFSSALKKSTDWKFGELECVLDFWGRLSEALPEEISSLFKVEFGENHFRKSDNVLIKSVPQKSNMILVAPSQKFKSIEQYLENNFIDEDAEDFFIKPEDQNEFSHILENPIEEKVFIPSKTTLTITNYPKILIFGVKRLDWNDETKSVEFNFQPLGFPETLMIENEEYSIVGNIEYDPKRIHYFSRNLDLLDDQWYVHDDRNVEMVPDTTEAFNSMSINVAHTSCMVFYVRKSSLEEFRTDQSKLQVPIEVVNKLNSRLKSKRRVPKESVSEPIEQVVSVTATEELKRKPKRTSEQAQAQSYEQESDENVLKKAKTLKSKKKNIKSLRQVNEAVPVRASSFMDFRLGSKPFLFAGRDRNIVLEAFLMALAQNPAVVRKLFDVAKDKPREDIQFKFALIIFKILIGRMDIDTKQLSDELVNGHGIDFNHFYNAWMRIGELLPEEIVSFPDVKLIRYNFDEPINIANFEKCRHDVSLRPHKTLPIKSDVFLSGPCADHGSDDNSDPSQDLYCRCLFKSSGMILPLQITRFRPDAPEFYDNERLDFNDGGYVSYGFIGMIPQEKKFVAIFLDPKLSEIAHILERGTLRTVKIDSAHSAFISRLFRHNSALIFMAKPQFLSVEMPMLSEVPKNFIDEINSSLNQ